MFPDRFPFDVLDPAPDHCPTCRCAVDGPVESFCEFPDCSCHALWLEETPELEKRALWGDK